MPPKHTPQTWYLGPRQNMAGASWDISSSNWSYQLNQVISCGADPEVLMKNGNKRQLFHCGHCPALLWERALSEASFSRAFAWMSSPPGTATPIGQTNLPSLELQRMSSPLRRRVQSGMQFTVPLVLYYYCVAVFHGPWKETAQGGASTTYPRFKAMGTSCTNSINQTAKSSLLQCFPGSVITWQVQRPLSWWVREQGLTLADESLAGVQQYAALNVHSFMARFFLMFSVSSLHHAWPCQIQWDHKEVFYYPSR